VNRALRLGDQNSYHAIIHRLRQPPGLVWRRTIKKLEFDRHIRQRRHSLLKHFHPNDGLAVRPLNRFETATATLDRRVRHNFYLQN